VDFFTKKIALQEKANLSGNIQNPKQIANQIAQKPNPEPLKNVNSEVIKKQIISEEGNFANKLLTKSVVSHIEEIKSQSGDYIPKRVNKSIRLPVIKSSAEYKNLKEEIICNIEDGICELEYFNIDHAKEYVESALYYLKNIIEKK